MVGINGLSSSEISIHDTSDDREAVAAFAFKVLILSVNADGPIVEWADPDERETVSILSRHCDIASCVEIRGIFGDSCGGVCLLLLKLFLSVTQ